MAFDPSAVKLGKKIPVIDRRTLLFEKYVPRTVLLPYIPSAYAWGAGVPRWPMYGNDVMGDCTIASVAHQEGVWSFRETGKETIVPDATILMAYEAVSGYLPGNPLTDNGADMLSVMRYWSSIGVGASPLIGYTAILPQNVAHVQAAIFLFGGIFVGVQLPVTAQAQVAHNGVWSLAPDYLTNPDAAPGSWGGHAIPIIGYSQTSLTLITWGRPMTMTWPWFHAYCDEVFSGVSPAWVSAAGIAPNHFNLAQLETDIAGIT